MERRTTALGMAVYAREGVPRSPLSGEEIERRVAALLAVRGPMTLSQLRQAFHHNVEQERLHRAIAALRDAGRARVRTERRCRRGRARVVVAPVARDEG